MAIYANYEYYHDVFRKKWQPIIPEEAFPFTEIQARALLDERTFNRVHTLLTPPSEYIDTSVEIDPRIPDEISMAVCAIAEIYYVFGLPMGEMFSNIFKILPQGITLKQVQGMSPPELEVLKTIEISKALSKYLAHSPHNWLFRG